MIDLNERISEKKNFFNRLVFVYIFFGFLFLYLIYKTFSLQVSSYTDYEIAALKNKTREILLQPRRGIIYDRNGQIISNNVPSYNLIIKPSEVKDLDSVLLNIRQIIDISDSQIDNIKDSYKTKKKLNRELILKKNLNNEEIAKFEVRKYKYPNLFIAERYSRESKYPNLFSHSVGYIGNTSEDKIEEILSLQNLKPKETIFKYSNGYMSGKTGLEYIYDKELRGLYGKKIFEVDASGKLLKERETTKAIDGKDIHTSLDLKAQQVAYKQLNNRRGAVVAIDLRNGSIVSYISSPSFSVNDITNGLSQDDFDKLINDKNKPFFDRAGQGRYSPASTIKPAIGLFGLEKNLIDWEFTIQDIGFFELPEDGRIYRGWKKGGHGKINLQDAIIESSNTFFFSLAYQTEVEELIEYLSNFGFGQNVCSDCFFPDKGLLPSPAWKMNTHNFGWFKGDTVNIGVGQGYLSATPLQLAYYSAFLANKGSIDSLSFVKYNKIKTKKKFISNNIKDNDWRKIHHSMIGVIESPKGTAGRLKNLKEYSIAAKSGTVELVSTETKEDYKLIRETEGKRDHAIIVAFGPMPEPRYAVSVVIENGESGGSVAGPVAIAVLNSLINNE